MADKMAAHVARMAAVEEAVALTPVAVMAAGAVMDNAYAVYRAVPHDHGATTGRMADLRRYMQYEHGRNKRSPAMWEAERWEFTTIQSNTTAAVAAAHMQWTAAMRVYQDALEHDAAVVTVLTTLRGIVDAVHAEEAAETEMRFTMAASAR